MNKDKLIAAWKKDVFDKSDKVDPGNELDWFSLAIGYFIAKGLNPEDAYNLSIHVRYQTS